MKYGTKSFFILLMICVSAAFTARVSFAKETIHQDGQACIPNTAIQNIYASLSALEAHGIDGLSFKKNFKRDIEALTSCEGRNQSVNDLLNRIHYGLENGFSARYSAQRTPHHFNAPIINASSTKAVASLWNQLASNRSEYASLQTVLANYQMFEKVSAWPAPVASGKTIKLGMHDDRLTQIQEHLYIVGDYTKRHTASKTQTPTHIYDEAMVDAVKSFQSRHGLEEDGAIGPQTLKAINMPLAERIGKIKLTMERLRKADFADTNYVHVNIPSYNLVAYENHQPALRMKVIVGKTKRKTPLFSNNITGLVFNPTWTPTQRILREDILPKIRNNPDYAARGNYTIIDRHSGEKLSPHEVDWEYVSEHDVRLRQGSGRGNAMGKVKFVLPKSNSIYLHDTAKPYLFQKARRALSSGCIRVENPKALVDYVVNQQKSLPYSRANRWYESTENRHVSIDNPVNVYTTYYTAWVNKKGQPTFYEDVYRKDKQLSLALHRNMGIDRSIQLAMK